MSSSLDAKIYSCWLGKAIGGTLGVPWEGKAGPHQLRFYDPVPHEPLPNDDLDLQLVWLHHLQATQAREVTPDILAEAWRLYVDFPFDEYAVCLRNQAYGLQGARLGSFDNWWGEGMGAAIRSEIWACLAPGDPARAAAFAWSDAVCDHGGDGVWAEVFLAALEAAAFSSNDVDQLLQVALDFLPDTSRVKRAIELTIRRWEETRDWRQVRADILTQFGHPNFTDAPMNLAFTMLGWLAGEGDFGKSICIAVNCGEDTDCTGATLGSLFGILHPEAIPTEWKAPIGERIVISPEVSRIEAPENLSALTEAVLRLKHQLRDFKPELGRVAPVRPAGAGDSPIRLHSLTGTTQQLDPLQRYETAVSLCRQEHVGYGHWERFDPGFTGGRVSKYQFQLEEAGSVLVQAFSQQAAQVWVDGVTPVSTPPDPHAERSSGPSFHRGGQCQYQTAPLEPGNHELLVSLWNEDGGNAPFDLVVGIGEVETRMWYPDAMTDSAPESADQPIATSSQPAYLA